IVSWSNTQIVATVASGSVTGSAQVQQGGVWSNSIAFTVTTPNLTSVSPTTARAGDSITLTGTNFGATQGSGSVWLGNKLAGSIVSWSDTQIVAIVASGAKSGSAQVQQGGVWSNSIAFTVITPNVTSISPTSGPVGTQVTITGTGFGTTQGSGLVWLGTKYATVVSWSDTQVVATVASGSATGGTQVYQNGVWSNAVTFTVTP
ncbi:MAG TPA: IPT/TIG domain-containing protein, partial [Thermoanaerobaculia bacterium]|nr:IPT/TIG domain-containing protein [Thermoanaerobaculia bacterium]